jgi:ATP-dependent DNA helicase RecG
MIKGGGLPRGLKIEDFGKESVLRNPNIANLMQRIEYIEKMGTGIVRMQNLLADVGLPPLRYKLSGFVWAIFYRYPATGHDAEYVAPQATPQDELSVDNEKIQKILSLCLEPRSREEIQLYLGLKDRKHFRSEILQPLLKEGLLVSTIPDKPNSPKQQYITVKGPKYGSAGNGQDWGTFYF